MDRPAFLVRTKVWWGDRSTRARLRFLVAGVGLLGLLLRDVLLVGAALFTLLLAETVPARRPQPRPLP